jgi:hypothetical protein
MPAPAASPFQVRPTGESVAPCACCGHESRTVWGFVHTGTETVATYFVHWTLRHIDETGAHFDFVIGDWGETATAARRAAISLLYRVGGDAGPAIMVIDAGGRPVAAPNMAGTALARDDVVGTPLAIQVFELIEAVLEQDERLF